MVGLDFSYINTTRLERLRDLNLPTPTVNVAGRRQYDLTKRPFVGFDTIRTQEASARSLYRALTVSVNVRRQRYVFDAYYTLSSNFSDDDNERNFAGIQYADAANLNNDYNFSRLDQRHQFMANGLVSLPFNFQLSGTTRISSARPFNALTGADDNRDGNFNDRPIINGVEIRRNTFRNLSNSDVSVRIQRAFNLPKEKGKVTFSFEMFNLFNFDNAQVGTGNQVFGPGTSVVNGQAVNVAPPQNFRQIRDKNGKYLTSTTLGDPFQAQIGVRFSF